MNQVTKYIYKSLVKAKITQKPSEYLWSSYNKYIDKYYGKDVEIDTGMVEGYFSKKRDYENYMMQTNNDQCLEYENKKKYTDKEIKEKLKNQYNLIEIKSLSKIDRNKIIKEIRKETGTSIRQLSRVLGMGRGVIEKVCRA